MLLEKIQNNKASRRFKIITYKNHLGLINNLTIITKYEDGLYLKFTDSCNFKIETKEPDELFKTIMDFIIDDNVDTLRILEEE